MKERPCEHARFGSHGGLRSSASSMRVVEVFPIFHLGTKEKLMVEAMPGDRTQPLDPL